LLRKSSPGIRSRVSGSRPAERYQYAWGEMILATSRQLPELTPSPHKRATFHLQWTRAQMNTQSCVWIHWWTAPNGGVWLTIGKTAGGYLFRFRRFADFHWSPRRRVLTCHIRPRTHMSTIRHLLLDQVLPSISSGEHGSGLHASAVVVGGEAVAFAGKTGLGKSTLAASFAAAGFPALTDDCLIVKESGEQFLAVPAYSSLRLWNDSANALGGDLGRRRRVAAYSQKIRVNGSTSKIPFCSNPAPLRCVYLLETRAAKRGVLIESLSERDAFIALVRLAFRLDPYDRIHLANEMDRLARLSRVVSVRRLHVPRRLENLSSVQKAVLLDLQKIRPARPMSAAG
jgi:energy-coupling factor transporter ATP-binding protein EcfA2